MGLWSNAARKSYIALHHVGAAGTQYNSPTPYAAPYDNCATANNKYDFAVNGNGVIAVGARYTNPLGCHAKTCNCEATGIIMLGCFGGCGGAGDSATASQRCGIAAIWAQTGISRSSDKLRPHKWCDVVNPCNSTQTGTICCGTRYAGTSSANHYWTASGVALRDDILSLANNGCIA